MNPAPPRLPPERVWMTVEYQLARLDEILEQISHNLNNERTEGRSGQHDTRK